jgi:hypothetical protein
MGRAVYYTIGAAMIIAGAVVVGVRAAHNDNGAAVKSASAGAGTPVIVELFTSEGCSSCPPADALLAQLVQTQPVAGAHVIALEEHVDYWNQLGWRDPFSSAAFSQRQGAYAAALKSDDVYTPEMIVDGQTGFIGSDAGAAEKAISEAARQPKARVTISMPLGRRLEIAVSGVPSSAQTADVYAAVTESGLASNVSRGENEGRRLMHTAVVRQLMRIGTVSPNGTFRGSFAFDRPAGSQMLSVVAFVQDRHSHRIFGSADFEAGGH